MALNWWVQVQIFWSFVLREAAIRVGRMSERHPSFDSDETQSWQGYRIQFALGVNACAYSILRLLALNSKAHDLAST